MSKWERSAWLIVVVLLIGALLGGGLGTRCDADSSRNEEDIELFLDVMEYVKNYYVEKPESRKLIKGAIEGMLKSLGDQHTYFMDEQKYKEIQVEIKGKFYGVGIEITMKNDMLTVVSPIEGTPAYRAGLLANDRIVKINGESTQGKTIMDAVQRIRGEKGTAVTLTIERDGLEEPFNVEIVRDEIKLKSLTSKIVGNKIGYVRLKRFDIQSASELANKLNEFKQKNIQGIILDLRGNPGGLLTAAIQIADFFLEDGIIVSTKGRTENENYVHKASKETTLVDPKVPVLVLVNHGSASASEIVAGALKDQKRATLLGMKTFGKASVQKFFPMRGNSVALRLTIAKYYTPNGNMIHGNGIQPDVEIKPLTFQKEENKSLKTFVEKKLMHKFMLKHKDAHYDDATVRAFSNFIKSNGAPMSDITARYLLKRELTLKSPIIDLEFDNQLKKALELIRKKI